MGSLTALAVNHVHEVRHELAAERDEDIAIVLVAAVARDDSLTARWRGQAQHIRGTMTSMCGAVIGRELFDDIDERARIIVRRCDELWRWVQAKVSS